MPEHTEAVLEQTPLDPPEESEPTPKPKVMGRPRKVITPPEDDRPLSLHREPSEDFFAYLQRIKPEDWSSSKTSGLYIYKKTLKGNVRLTDEPLKSPITLAELREQFYPVHGDGNYRVQFTTGLKHLTTCGENVTFDASGTTLESSSGASFGRTSAQHSDNGLSDAIRATSEMLKDGAKAAVEVSKAQQMDHGKPVDIAGIITAVSAAFASANPKHEDKTAELIMVMLQNQAKEAERRAEVAERRAEEQRRADREEAERRERQAKEEATASRDRDKQFFELMLKQAENKADSLNQMTGLLSNFIKVKNEIDDSLGGGPKGPWDLVGQVADGIIQNGPAIMAAVKGASPAQVQQMQQQAQNPQAPQPEAQPFYDMVSRLAKYFGRDPQLYDGHYVVQMLEEEYGAVFSEIINHPKEATLQAIGAFEPFGKAIMEHPQASVFMGKVIDAIKFPDTMDDIFGGSEEEESEDKEPLILRPRGRPKKINGSAKVAQVG